MNKRFVRFWKALAVVALFAILITFILQFFVQLEEPQRRLVELVDGAAIAILAVELAIRYIESKKKKHFFRNNWLLITSFFPFTSFFRVLRAIRIMQRAIGSWFSKGFHLFAHLARLYRVFALYFSKIKEKLAGKKK